MKIERKGKVRENITLEIRRQEGKRDAGEGKEKMVREKGSSDGVK